MAKRFGFQPEDEGSIPSTRNLLINNIILFPLVPFV